MRKIHKSFWRNSVYRGDQWWQTICGIFSVDTDKPANFKQGWDRVTCKRCLKKRSAKAKKRMEEG